MTKSSFLFHCFSSTFYSRVTKHVRTMFCQFKCLLVWVGLNFSFLQLSIWQSPGLALLSDDVKMTRVKSRNVRKARGLEKESHEPPGKRSDNYSARLRGLRYSFCDFNIIPTIAIVASLQNKFQVIIIKAGHLFQDYCISKSCSLSCKWLFLECPHTCLCNPLNIKKNAFAMREYLNHILHLFFLFFCIIASVAWSQ